MVHDFALCPSVGYAVPAPPALAYSDVLAAYTAQLQPSLAAFNLTVSTFPCGDPEQGMYSFVRTCADCLTAYTDWLCAVAMPRCDDVPAAQRAVAAAELAQFNAAETASTLVDAAVNAGSSPPGGQTVFNALPVSTVLESRIVRVDPLSSRTPLWAPSVISDLNLSIPLTAADSPFPYAEVPPCDALCYLVAASCPPLVQWSCPLPGITSEMSYGRFVNLPPALRAGGDERSLVAAGGKRGASASVGGDRFGNVYCNALGSDVLLARRGEASRTGPARWAMLAALAAASIPLRTTAR